jgi:hypothetical protein
MCGYRVGQLAERSGLTPRDSDRGSGCRLALPNFDNPNLSLFFSGKSNFVAASQR